MSVEALRTDVIVFICDVMCFSSDWSINLHMRVSNWPNIFVDQGQFSDPDFTAAHIQGKMSNLPIKLKYC
jgi:activator of HSP90 ATPase